MEQNSQNSLNDRFRRSGKAVLMVAFFSILAKVLGMVRTMVMTNFYGASIVSDAYNLAQSIPNTLFNLVGMAVGVSFTPMFQDILVKQGEGEADKFTANVKNILLIIITAFVVSIYFLARPIILVFAGGAPDETINTAATFLKISVFALYFIGINNLSQSYLKGKGSFFASAMIGMPLSIVEIVSIIVAVRTDDRVLAVGIVAAAFAQWIILFVNSWRLGYRPRLVLDLKHSHIARMLFMSLPIFIGICIDEVNVIIDKRIASGFDEGSISLLTIAHTLVSIVHSTIAVSFNTVMYPKLSAAVAANDSDGITHTIRENVEKSMLLTVPAMVGIIVFARPVIDVLYGRGKFTPENVTAAAIMLQLYAICLIPNALRTLTQSYFYAHEKSRTCMIATVIGVVLNIGLNFLFSHFMGVYGLALATSISILVTAMLLIVIIERKKKLFRDKTFLLKLLKCTVCSAVMGGVGYTTILLASALGINAKFALVPQVIICIAVYFGAALLTKTVDKNELKTIIKRK